MALNPTKCLTIAFSGNHYGTPKPSPDSPAKTDTVIPGAHPSSEVRLIHLILILMDLVLMFLVDLILVLVFLVCMIFVVILMMVIQKVAPKQRGKPDPLDLGELDLDVLDNGGDLDEHDLGGDPDLMDFCVMVILMDMVLVTIIELFKT